MILRRLAVVFAVAVLLCTVPASAARSPDEIVLADSTEFQTLDPLYMFGSSAVRLGGLIYSQLFHWNANGDLIPCVATRIPTLANGGISKNGLLITYDLRHDVKWADGVPLTARDIIFTHDAFLNPRNSVASRQPDDRIASIRAPNPFTVVIRLREPYSAFIARFNWPILPAHLLARYSSLDRVDYNAQPVGSGPYRVLEWRRGDHLILMRNENYWGPKPRIARITIRFISSPSTIVTELKSGDIDGASIIDPSYVKTFMSDPRFEMQKTSGAFGILAFNTSHPLLSDVRVRHAIAQAIDRVTVVRSATEGFDDPSQPGRAMLGWAYDPSIKELPFDPAAARKLLKAAGWQLGTNGILTKGGQPFDLNLATQTGHVQLAIEANEIAQDLKAVGIQVNIQQYTDPEYFAVQNGVLAAGRFDVTLSRFGAGDAPFDVADYLGCDRAGKPRTYNFSRFCGREMQRAMRVALTTYDKRKELQAFHVVQLEMERQVPLIVMSRVYYFYVYSSRLHGFVSTPYGEFENVGSWWLAS